MRHFLGGWVLATIVSLGCSPETAVTETAPPRPDGIAVSVHTDQALSGTFTFGEFRLDFSSVETSPGLVDLRYQTADLVVTVKVDYGTGVGSYDSSGAIVTAEDKELLLQFAGQLAGLLPAGSSRTMAENAIFRQTSHLAQAPQDQVIPAFVFMAERSWQHLPCSCVYAKLLADNASSAKCHFGGGASPASSCRYYYVSPGHRYWFITGKYCNTTYGGYQYGSCRGRCGVGCGWDNVCDWYGTGTYTFDCAEHDANIAGWGQASDDYAFSSYNCC